MTEGEKMVWATTYALHFKQEYDREGEYGKDRAPHCTPTAIEWAWASVIEMRESRPEVEEGWGDGDVLEMLDEMLSAAYDDDRQNQPADS